jgi:hypothetical protein
VAMSDQELRDLVRESIARQFRRDVPSPNLDAAGVRHASHVIFPVASGSAGDGACLIEPAVRCNHCGYCQSYGH